MTEQATTIRGARGFSALMLCFAVIAAAAGPAGADSPRRLVSRGNASLRKGDADGAIEQYERASVDLPESPVIDFNIGAALFRKGEFSAARERFVEAAEQTRELDLEGRAWYNAGNCAFREGQRMLDGDPEQALERFRESARFYTTALERNPGDEDAAWNLELARLYVKDVLDRIRKMREETAEAREAMKEVADSLAALIERERAAVEASDSLATADTAAAEWRGGVAANGREQRSIDEGTARAAARLDSLFAQPPERVGEARAHLDSALVAGDAAARELEAAHPGQAAPGQRKALIQLMKALQSLAGDESGDGKGDGNEARGDRDPQQRQEPQQRQQPEQQTVQARDETARGIIDEEEEHRKERRRAASGGDRKVDRDW